VAVNGGMLTIELAVCDSFGSFATTTTGGYIKVAAAALDQGDYIIDDPSNLLKGEIAYTGGAGLQGLRGGANVVARKLGEPQQNALLNGLLLGAKTLGAPVFSPEGQTPRAWFGSAVAPNGDVYATVFSGKVYVQSGGHGAFVALADALFPGSVGTANWSAVCVAENGDVYVAIYGGDILYRAKGIGNFVALSQTSRNWQYMAASPNGDIYVTVDHVDVFKRALGAGDFVGTSLGANAYAGIAVTPNLDVFVALPGASGGILKRPLGVGGWNWLESTDRTWKGLCGCRNGDVYGCVLSGDIYKLPSGGTAFVALSQTSRSWYSLASGNDGRVFAFDSGGDVYMQLFPLYSAIAIA
jgi:hypothetical protein